MTERKVRFFYNVEQVLYYIDDDDENNIMKSHSVKDKNKYLLEGFNYFEAGKDYTQTREDLIRYKTDFNKYNEKILKGFKKQKINYNYKTKYNHNDAVLRLYKYLQCRELKKYEFDRVKSKEFKWVEGCNNGALISMNDDYNDKIINSYGYDYASYYPNLLNSGLLFLPYKEGHEIEINKLDFENLKYGIYKVLVKTDNEDFIKLFKFSQYAYYTHYDLIFLNKHKKQFNIELTLLTGSINCIYWNDDELINTKNIVSNWFKILTDMRKTDKDNFILKRCLSSLWGSWSGFKKIFFDETEIKEDMSISRLMSNKETEYKIIDTKTYHDNKNELGYRKTYICVKSDDPYKEVFIRIKPFIMSLSRLNIADVIIENNLINNLIRIHTDNITLNIPFDFSKHYEYYPIAEGKTTGLIKWRNCNNYYHNCPKCKIEFEEYKLFKCHSC